MESLKTHIPPLPKYIFDGKKQHPLKARQGHVKRMCDMSGSNSKNRVGDGIRRNLDYMLEPACAVHIFAILRFVEIMVDAIISPESSSGLHYSRAKASTTTAGMLCRKLTTFPELVELQSVGALRSSDWMNSNAVPCCFAT